MWKPPIPANKSMKENFFFDIKASLPFKKGSVEEDAFNQGLAQPTSDNNLAVHAHIERKHLVACLTDVFSSVLIMVNQSKQDAKDAKLPFPVFF